MADIVFNCMYCNESLIVDARGIGLEVPCPHCLHKIEIPEDAEPVVDPSTIFEVEAPAQSEGEKQKTCEETPEPLTSEQELEAEGVLAGDTIPAIAEGAEKVTEDRKTDDGDDDDRDDPDSPSQTPLEDDSAETILSLLESLLDRPQSFPPNDEDGGKKVASPPSNRAAETKGIANKLSTTIEELKSRMDIMYEAYCDAGRQVDKLSNENANLKERIESGEVEREGLSARLDDFSQAVNIGGILNKSTEHASDRYKHDEDILSRLLARFRIPYQVAAGLIVLSTAFLLIGFHLADQRGETATNHAATDNTNDWAAEHLVYRDLLIKERAMFSSVEIRAYDVKMVPGSKLENGSFSRLDKDQDYLVLYTTLTNTNAKDPIHLRYLWDDARLEDNEGNLLIPRLDEITDPDEQRSKQPPTTTLRAGERINSIVIFDAPSPRAKSFSLVCRPLLGQQNERGVIERLATDGMRLNFNRNEITQSVGR